MKRAVWSLPLVLVLAGVAMGQDAADDLFGPPAPPRVAPSQPIAANLNGREPLPEYGSVTPEVWLYLQEMRRYDDPRQAVRRKAEQRGAERQARLASQRWFGVSNSRPQAAVTPFLDVYSPTWAGNGWHPYHWVGVGHPPSVAIYVEPEAVRRR